MIIKATEDYIDSIYIIWEKEIKKYNKEIKSEFWEDKKDIMINYFKTKEVFLYLRDLNIIAFICFEEDGNIVSLFTKEEFQNQKVGSELLNFVKGIKQKLYVSVYSKNDKSNNFFLKNNFKKKHLQIDNNTLCEEFLYEWSKNEQLQ